MEKQQKENQKGGMVGSMVSLPIAPYFCLDENGEVGIRLNGEVVDLEYLRRCRDALEYWLQNIDETDIETHNKKARDEWQREMEVPKKQDRVCREGYIYLIKSNGIYKFGRANSLERIRSYRTENPFGIEVVKIASSKDYIGEERRILEMFNDRIVLGKEWLDLNEEELSCILLEMEKLNNNRYGKE